MGGCKLGRKAAELISNSIMPLVKSVNHSNKKILIENHPTSELKYIMHLYILPIYHFSALKFVLFYFHGKNKISISH